MTLIMIVFMAVILLMLLTVTFFAVVYGDMHDPSGCDDCFRDNKGRHVYYDREIINRDTMEPSES